MTNEREWKVCPRCAAEAFPVGTGALSRVTRDEGAAVEVCGRCGRREALYGRDPANQAPLAEWPLSVDQLVEEERYLIAQAQGSEFTTLSVGDLELGE